MDEKITILVIGSSDDTIDSIKLFVDAAPGLELVGTAAKGVEGIDLAQKLNPDFVLVDRSVGSIEDSVSIARTIKQTLPETKVIMMSVSNQPEWLRESILAGADNFLSKPLLSTHFIETIRTTHPRESRKAESQ